MSVHYSVLLKTSKKKKNIGVFKEDHVFSFSYPSIFADINSIIYPDLETFYQAERAKYFQDFVSYAKILTSPSAGFSRRVGEELLEWDDAREETDYLEAWDIVKPAILKKGLRYKFTQNPGMGECLKLTDGMLLVNASEPSEEPEWTCGCDYASPDCFDPTQFTEENLLGSLLMEVRDTVGLISPLSIPHTA